MKKIFVVFICLFLVVPSLFAELPYIQFEYSQINMDGHNYKFDLGQPSTLVEKYFSFKSEIPLTDRFSLLGSFITSFRQIENQEIYYLSHSISKFQGNNFSLGFKFYIK